MRKLLLTTALAGGFALPAMAAEITMGASTTGLATFTGTGATGNLNVSLSSTTGQALDGLGGSGAYALSAFGPSLATHTAIPGVWDFGAGVTNTFAYAGGGNSLTETFTYSSINDGSVNPHFAGTDVVTAISGSAAFLATYGGVGRGSTFDFTTNAVGTILDTLALTTASESVGVSSGEVVPNAAPEPGTLALLGVSLLGLGLTQLRRRH